MNVQDAGPLRSSIAPLWEVRGISKAFPGVQALSAVSVGLYAGEIHAMVGENGSGKSTLAKVLTGAHQPDDGEIRFAGSPVTFPHPTAARERGVAAIYQEFSLVPTLSVAENICLGRLPRSGPALVDWAAMHRHAADVLNQLGLRIDVGSPVQSLSVAEQQLVEIAKAIAADSQLLIMDEPTTALALDETQRLHDLIRRLAERGRAILYISHRLHEIIGLAHRVTVLKDGRVVATRLARELDLNTIVRLMVGSEIAEHYPKQHHATKRPLLEVRDLRTERGAHGVTLTVMRGEVLGLAGVVGSGRTAIARALAGVDPTTSGTVALEGRPVRFHSPAQAIGAGIALIPENRKSDGLFWNFTGTGNITISRLQALLRGPLMSLQREQELGGTFMERLRIDPAARWKTVRFLSGGTQQKVLIARWLFAETKVLILDEPTQGIDVGAKVEVYRLINELTAQGMAVILISSDYRELLAMSDRVAVIREGRVLRIVPAGSLDEYAIVAAASGARAADA
ncbi:MAG TPA: sugar ABC transporter ATP-binding protein [bacterium]|nr:sugar ABC transporter ATP-binding protein [bacterium]